MTRKLQRTEWKCMCCGGIWSMLAERRVYDATSFCERCNLEKCSGKWPDRPCEEGRKKVSP